jgi:hypothetical protein
MATKLLNHNIVTRSLWMPGTCHSSSSYKKSFRRTRQQKLNPQRAGMAHGLRYHLRLIRLLDREEPLVPSLRLADLVGCNSAR